VQIVCTGRPEVSQVKVRSDEGRVRIGESGKV
jgi:hypothetical protein